jgi:RNA polymerase sigma-70 factor (ECF subfamily)
MEPDGDDATVRLVERWRTGDETAARELYERYAERLIALAQTRMSLRLAGRVDAEDVVQSVFRSFFGAVRQGRYAFRNSGDLWKLLLGITRNKFLFQVEHHTAGKRDANREAVGDTNGFVSREPSPEEAAALTDLLESVLGKFDATARQMVELRLQGHQLEDIARAVGRCRHTVLRTLDRFKAEVRKANDSERSGYS